MTFGTVKRMCLSLKHTSAFKNTLYPNTQRQCFYSQLPRLMWEFTKNHIGKPTKREEHWSGTGKLRDGSIFILQTVLTLFWHSQVAEKGGKAALRRWGLHVAAPENLPHVSYLTSNPHQFLFRSHTFEFIPDVKGNGNEIEKKLWFCLARTRKCFSATPVVSEWSSFTFWNYKCWESSLSAWTQGEPIEIIQCFFPIETGKQRKT